MSRKSGSQLSAKDMRQLKKPEPIPIRPDRDGL
jgi:hypothetical protein